MKIVIGTEAQDIASPLPETPFLARHFNINSGALCIVSTNVGLGMAPHYNVMFLEGTSGPAQGDVWNGIKQDVILREFIPLRVSVTMTNRWR
jgi:hypothetical protein